MVDARRRARTGATLDAVVADIGARAAARARPSSIETTLPVGTTRDRIAPALEAATGLRAEQDFCVVFSPERVFSGRVLRDLATYPKLVGGLSAARRGARRRALRARSWTPRCGRWAPPRRPS